MDLAQITKTGGADAGTYDIRDKKLADADTISGTSGVSLSAGTATKDAVMLLKKKANASDPDEYAEIDYDSFASAVKDVIGTYIYGDTKTTATHIPTVASNGELGAISAANLASVLGVPYSVEANNATPTNPPSGASVYGTHYMFQGTGYYKLHIWIQHDAKKMWVGTSSGGNTQPTEWFLVFSS